MKTVCLFNESLQVYLLIYFLHAKHINSNAMNELSIENYQFSFWMIKTRITFKYKAVYNLKDLY